MSDQPTGDVPKRRLTQRYELGQMIGRGGMAEVFEGQDLRLNRKVAVKILRPDLVQDSTFHQRFRREAHSAASLDPLPNIVAVYDTGEDLLDGPVPVPFIVMEFVDGMTLKQLMSSGRRLLPERALELTSGVLAALDYSHRHGIVHRDIKPANVMLTPGGEIKVMDFGIARALASEGQTVTSTSAVMGTAQYLSPEQARGEVVDARSHLYSTGCMLFELLCSRPPFIGESPVSIAYQHVSEMPTPPSQLDPAVPESVDAVVMRALAKDVTDRYQSAAEFRADVDRAIAGAPVTAALASAGGAAAATQIISPTGATKAAPPPAKPAAKQTSPWVWVGVAAAILVVGGLAIALGSSLFGGSETVSVPTLRGMTVDEANSELTQAGLRLGEATPEASDEESGTIIEQDPSPGEQIQQGQAVNVTVSAGPEEVLVPQLVGLDSADAAREALGEVELVLGTTTPRDSDQPEGFVLESDPVGGSTAAKGDRVDIVVSSGFLTIPNVVGQTEDSARSDISAAGLEAEVVYQTGTSGVGTVVAQSPDGGARAKKGDTVTIDVVQAPEPTPTPTPTPTVTATPPPPPPGEGGGVADQGGDAGATQ